MLEKPRCLVFKVAMVGTVNPSYLSSAERRREGDKTGGAPISWKATRVTTTDLIWGYQGNQQLVTAANGNCSCSMFLTVPGKDSFYFITLPA